MPVTSDLSPAEYYQKVVTLFQQKGDPDRAQGQMWYMRHQFEFFGLKAPEWLALGKIIFDEYGIPEGAALLETARSSITALRPKQTRISKAIICFCSIAVRNMKAAAPPTSRAPSPSANQRRK